MGSGTASFPREALAVREFDDVIGRAWRRLRLQRFLTVLVWCWGAALAAAAVAIAVEKVLGPAVPGPDWLPLALAGGVGLIVAAAIALVTGPDRLDAAVAIDRAFHLNERLSTALSLPEALRETPAGRALVADTLRHVAALDIGSQFVLHLPRRAWIPLIPAALAAALLIVPLGSQRSAQAALTAAQQLDQEAVAQQAEALTKRIGEARQEIDPARSAETEKLLAEIEKAADRLAQSPPAAKDKALVELNKLTDALKDRQKQLGTAEQIGRQLQQLQRMASDGPADDFAKDLSKGDFQQAAEQLQQLREKIASGTLTEAEKQLLQQQLGGMKQQLEKLANLEQRRKQLEDARQGGALTPEQYQQQMAKLNDQARDLQKLQQLAQQLDQCQQCLGQGDMQKAADALGMSQQQLQQMAQDLSELETLDQALADLQDAKDGMTGGDGLNRLGQGMGNSPGDSPNPMGSPGPGLGRGRGAGDRPEAVDKTATYRTKTPSQYTKGQAVVEGLGPYGQQNKGDSLIEAQETIEAASGVAAEALSNQKVPNTVKKHVAGYFDKIRGGR
jgi:hypothetical protein